MEARRISEEPWKPDVTEEIMETRRVTEQIMETRRVTEQIMETRRVSEGRPSVSEESKSPSLTRRAYILWSLAHASGFRRNHHFSLPCLRR